MIHGAYRTGPFGLGAYGVGAALIGAVLTVGILAGAGEIRLAGGDAIANTGDTPDDVTARSLASSLPLFAEREGGGRRSGTGVVLLAAGEYNLTILPARPRLAP